MAVKRVTSQDVADHAGVSRTTVSLVLNNVDTIKISSATRQRVLESAESLGYIPDAAAQTLAGRRSRIIGLILTRRPHHIASDVFLTQILNGLFEIVHENGIRLLVDIVEPQHQKEAYLQMARANRIDGILLSGPRADDEALNALEEDGFPAVLIGQLPGANFCSVDVDNRAASRTVVEHLLNLGHTRIACITNANLSYTAAVDRLDGYRQALQSRDLAFDAGLVREGDFDVESGYNQMHDLLETGAHFTAAFVASDALALGAKAALRERGLHIPDQIALVGFDDLPYAQYLDPPLTTVRISAVELARQASEMLFRVMDGDIPACRQVTLDTQLIVRKSCGANQ